MDSADLRTVRLLLSLSQRSLFVEWDAPNTRDADKGRLLAQIRCLDADWDLRRNYLRARRLLSQSAIRRFVDGPYRIVVRAQCCLCGMCCCG